MNEDLKKEMVEAEERLAQMFQDCIERFFVGGSNDERSPWEFAQKPMLLAMMRHHKGNQTKTSIHLKLARGTLRKELQKHFGTTDADLILKNPFEAVVEKEKELCWERP